MYVDLVNTSIPEPSVIVDIGRVKEIPREVGGIYFLYDDRGDLLYVGKSVNLYSRVTAHVNGKSSNTEHFHKDISEIECITTDSRLDQDVLETIAINTMFPKYNKDKIFISKKADSFTFKDQVIKDVAEIVAVNFRGNASFGEVLRILKRKGYDYFHLNTSPILTTLRTIGIRKAANTLEVFNEQLVRDYLELRKDWDVVKDRLAYLSIEV